MMMARLCAEGPVRVHLEMGAHMEPDADSGDVIGEIPGREHPEEVVVIGGHIDSWDVGQGAQDDGASIMACLQARGADEEAGSATAAHPPRGLLGERGERRPRRRGLSRNGWATRSGTTWRRSRWMAAPKRRADMAPA